MKEVVAVLTLHETSETAKGVRERERERKAGSRGWQWIETQDKLYHRGLEKTSNERNERRP